LHLDPRMIANVFSIGLVGNLIGSLGFGYLGDMIGRRPTIIMCTLAFGILTLGMATSGSYETLLIFRLFNGIAIGGMLPLGWALNIEYVPRRFRASVVTVIMIGYSLGVLAGGVRGGRGALDRGGGGAVPVAAGIGALPYQPWQASGPDRQDRACAGAR